ncbi:MAG: 16S rRNA (adenine(1518)-N(6)/adenine(1519)-N(6))-dimethyltransferase RsmA [Candidatus Brocadiia bacterium]
MDAKAPLRHQDDGIANAMAGVRTQRQLAALLRRLGIRPSRRRGQSFLVDHNLLDFIVRTGEVGPRDLALDIGCGTGLLTAHLAEAAGKVVGIEVDPQLLAIAARYVGARANVELLRGDVLASKHALAPEFLEKVWAEWEGGRYAALRVVANLPYSIASLVVPNLLESDLPLTLIVVTVQKEVAERLAAPPGCGAYGSLSLIVQAHARVEVARSVPPTVFWPRPKVESAIVRLEPRGDYLGQIADYATFVATVRSAFALRRKTLANALQAADLLAKGPGGRAVLAACGIAPQARAEHLGIDHYVRLANALASREPQQEER